MPIDPAWRRWGPYLAERAWGTVREDYSADGDAWDVLPHDHARSRAYRWSEDGLGGHLRRPPAAVLRVRVLERRDPILKERIFGLTGTRATTARTPRSTGGTSTPRRRTRGCAGATSTRRASSRTSDLVAENRAPRPAEPEYELLDTGVFDEDRYWDITVDYAKADPDDIVHPAVGPQRRAGRRRRCTCCRRCGSATRGRGAATTAGPCIRGDGRRLVGRARTSSAACGLTGDGAPDGAVLRQRDERASGCGGQPAVDRLPEGRDRRPRRRRRADRQPGATGTKAALWYRLEVAAGRDRRGPAAPARPKRATSTRASTATLRRRASARPTRSTPS